MFGLSFAEIVIIAVLALILLGPDQLPSAARTLGKLARDFRRASEDLKGQIETELYADERKTRPSLVPPVPTAAVPPPAGPPPAATAENVPGLDAALAEATEPGPPAAEASPPSTPRQP